MPSYQIIEGDVTPLPKDVLVQEMEQGYTKTLSGVILLDDSDARDANIKARWCKVYKTGSEVTDVKPGQWVLVEHGRWTYGIRLNNGTEEIYLQKVDPKSIMVVSDDNLNTGRVTQI